MARTSKESKRAARAAAMQLLYEAFAGGDGGEPSIQMAYEILRDAGIVTSAMDETLGAKIPAETPQETAEAHGEALEAPMPVKRALPNSADRTFITELVMGVTKEAPQLDQHIETAAIDWPIHRIARVDLVILRMGVWELIHRPQLAPAIVVNEAVLLANQFSEPTSGRFINGVLGTIGRALHKADE